MAKNTYKIKPATMKKTSSPLMSLTNLNKSSTKPSYTSKKSKSFGKYK